MLIVCTSSTETSLALIGDLMTLLNTTASSSGMVKALEDATSWAEGYVSNRLNGSIRREVVLETLPGTGSQRLMLSRTPVWAIQRMFDGTDTGTATEYCSTDRRLENPEAGFLELTGNSGFAWTPIMDWGLSMYPRPQQVYRPWMVVYEAGWQLTPSTSTSEYVTTSTYRTLPEDIERAILFKAAEIYQGNPEGISSMRVGPLEMTFGSNFASVQLDPIKAMLGPYRKVV